jgi:hypothetical protein
MLKKGGKRKAEIKEEGGCLFGAGPMSRWLGVVSSRL